MLTKRHCKLYVYLWASLNEHLCTEIFTYVLYTYVCIIYVCIIFHFNIYYTIQKRALISFSSFMVVQLHINGVYVYMWYKLEFCNIHIRIWFLFFFAILRTCYTEVYVYCVYFFFIFFCKEKYLNTLYFLDCIVYVCRRASILLPCDCAFENLY